jgi:hypothetical protein
MPDIAIANDGATSAAMLTLQKKPNKYGRYEKQRPNYVFEKEN